MRAASATVEEIQSYRWWVLITVVFAAFASILDTTIVNTALPTIQILFHSGIHEASYVATGYILAAGIVVPATAYVANRFGIKRIYLLSLTLFTIGSALCGAAPSMEWLIAFRVLQGVGGAALFPLSFALLFQVFPPEERGKANGIFGIPVLAAPALGPTLGGYLSEYVDWRWVFYVNLPIGIIGVILGLYVLREVPPKHDLRLDWVGLLFAASGFGLLLLGFSNSAYDGWSSWGSVSGPILLAVFLLILFVLRTLRIAYPLLDLRLYERHNYRVATCITLLAMTGLFAPAFFLPQFLQILRGQTPVQAGLLLLWQGLGAIVGSVLTGQLYRRVGPKRLAIIGGVLLVVTSLLLMLWITPDSSFIALVCILIPRGIGLPLLMQSVNTVGLEGIHGSALPNATTLSVVGRNVMGSLSIALLTNYLHSRSTLRLEALGSKVKGVLSTVAEPAVGTRISAPVLQALTAAYRDTFFLAMLLALPIILLTWFLQPGRNSGTQAPTE